ncbi:MAG: histidine kinase [Bacteroidota bacterium]
MTPQQLQNKKWNKTEYLIYLILWLFLFMLPVLYSAPEEPGRWVIISGAWISTIAFLGIFIINNSLLVPRFLFHGKRTQYFLFVFLFVFIFVALGLLGESLHHDLTKEWMRNLHSGPHHPPPFKKFNPWLIDFVNNFIIAVLMIGFNTAIKVSAKWFKDEQTIKDLEKEHLQSKLAFLQNQISPHFFMNTLNNIHAMIDFDKDKSREAIIRLSKLMRYLLYETEHSNTTLSKEIEFLNNYIELMRLRISNKVAIRFHFPDVIPNISLPPLIFISLIENAFKHGISYQEYSFVETSLSCDAGQIVFKVRNSRHVSSAREENLASGIGLENIKNRLNLLFPNRYTLEISEREKEFEVTLTLNLNEN